MLGLIILGIAAVAIAAILIYEALSGARKDADENFSNKCVGSPSQPCPEKKMISIEWVEQDAWCSEQPTIKGKTQSWPDGTSVAITVDILSSKLPGKPVGAIGASTGVASFDENVHGDSFQHQWRAIDVLPVQDGGHYVDLENLNGHAEDKTTPAPLKFHFIPNAPKTTYHVNRAHFDLSAEDYAIKIESEIHFVKGWAGQVVKLGAAAASGTGGLLDGQLTWAGYRWMKTVGVTPKFWNGTAWADLPSGFALADANNFCVGFYKTGTTYTCQYGGTWPEAFADWDISATAKQQKLRDWEDNIKTTWTGKFNIKRKECKSTTAACCSYQTKAEAKFKQEATFAAGMMIIADGNIRSNDSLLFIDEPRIMVAGHEFGHHLGNPDEYAGAAIDASLNSDGAVNGIDADSVMGQNLTKVKKRHYQKICTHFADIVKTNFSKTYTYEAVDL